ncbi:glycosyltransferase family 2 protein [Aquimarina intermedia]|uniref:Glycosyltransferase involved in cell wall biosynthesis n=1 Tax=Aquimarina intermedia TaxID=350814 RepID=A0A5S5BTW3_9FLAO|nr:glycosyltransferase family 2 protein [Aquimarina intermedia]TYP70459.1 glycosyltransferase involved in cell wall biosynthesis [Aquimarina intermedia]
MQNTVKLSGVIITYNEERKIETCLKSLQGVVDEIVVVDSFSTDRTEEICNQYDVKFIKQQFLGYKEQKNFVISQASYDHIISLDGDEALSEELQETIIALKSNWVHDGYYMNRYNNFCGQWINHSDWYPDRKLRAFVKGKGEWKGINPHDSYKLYNPKNSAKLKGDILHWNYPTYSAFNQQIEKFSTISAHSYHELGKKSSLWKLFFNPSWAFLKSYVWRLGFLDGINGFVICSQTANLTFLKYLKLRELNKKNT